LSFVNDQSSEGDLEHMIVLPLDRFLETFSEAEELSNLVEHKTKEEARRWDSINGDPSCAGKRTPTERSFVLFEHCWKLYGKYPHRGVCKLGLTTWGFTQLYRDDTNAPRVRAFDVKVSLPPPLLLLLLLLVPNNSSLAQATIQGLSTVGAKDSVDKLGVVDSLRHQAKGYNAVSSHLVAFLRSSKFGKWFQEMSDYRQQVLEEQELAGNNKRQNNKTGFAAAAAGAAGNNAEELLKERKRPAAAAAVVECHVEEEELAPPPEKKKKRKKKKQQQPPHVLHLDQAAADLESSPSSSSAEDN
jgi:hypothetical protein